MVVDRVRALRQYLRACPYLRPQPAVTQSLSTPKVAAGAGLRRTGRIELGAIRAEVGSISSELGSIGVPPRSIRPIDPGRLSVDPRPARETAFTRSPTLARYATA